MTDGSSSSYDLADAAADIAVIGMAGRFPGARDLTRFWENIANGVESIAVLSDAELAAAGVPESVRRSPGYVPVSSRLDDVDRFDAEFFGYSPREAALLDPQGRVGLELAWHALEDAGYDSLDYRGAIGVFASASLSTYLLQNLAGRLDAQDFVLGLGNIPIVLGNGPDFAATRVSYKLNLRGPSQSVQTACSSSLAAIHLARQSLLNGECDMALAGGVSIYLPQDRGYRWQEGMILSSDGHVRAFDADADGVVFGRGGGVVVLKPLARALEDGDRIRAVIKGSAMNNDGSRKAGFTAPSVTGQSRVITEALADAGVRADSISYVEAHGTGTALGDPIEVAGLTEAFRKHTTRTGYCALGTVKTNIGHLDVAAGVTALIKTVLMLEHRQLPPSLHYRRPNPAIDFGSSPFFVNTSLRPWEGVAGTRRAGVSAFGIGGTNVHLVVEEARSPARTDHRALRPMQLMRVTARTDEALATLCGALADRLTGAGEMELADVSYTANTGRAHQARRVAVRGTSALEMSDGLLAAARGEDDPRVVRGLAAQNDAPPVAFLFTGLGAQSAGMGASLFRSEPVFRGALERCDVLLRPYLARPLLSVIYPPEGEPSPIDETTYGQPVMFAFEYALAELWKSWGVRPAALLGHSLGEYAAACVSGLLSLDDALRLVSTRARLADSLPAGGGMAAVFASEEQVRDAIGRDADRVWIASVNGPQSQVMSGAVDALARVAARLAEQHVEVRMLNVAQAFHSGMLEPMLDEYEAALSRTRFGRAETPIISNVTGAVLADADGRTARYWRRHAREAVRFADGVMTLYARGIRHFLEIGPHTTAMAMAAGCLTDDGVVFVPSLRRGRDDFDQLFETVSTLYVGGVDVTWAEFHATHAGRRVALPLYPFARTRHWIDTDTGAAPVPADRESPMGPLLGPQVRSPLIGVPVYDLRVGAAAQPFLGDHQVFGATVFPATAYIEAALEAAEAAGGRRATVVEGIEITEPLILPPGNTPRVQVILRPEAGCDAFEIVSQPSDDAAGASWRRHASGRVARNGASAPGAAARLDLDAVRSRCGAAVSGEQFYAGLAAQGFGYGPSFRGLGRLWLGDGEILGEVELPAILGGEPDAFQFHPALLDACLQSVLGLAPPGRAFVPTGVERVELRGWEPRLFAHAVRRAGSVEARVFFADVRIANARGEIVAALEGIALHEASAQKWRTDVGDVWESWLYEPTWREMAPTEKSAGGSRDTGGRHVGRKYLLVGDESSAAAGFAKCVRDAGATACVVSHAALIEHGDAVLDAATADGSVDAVIVVAAQNPNAPVAAPLDPSAGTRALLSVVQWLIGDSSSSGARLWIVTGGAQGVVVGDAVAGVFDAPMWGLATVVSLEHPELRCSCIDVESAADIPADAIWREVTADSAETRIAYRGGVRHVARLARPARAAKSAANIARRLTSIEPGALDGLRYADEPRRAPRAGEVEILVRAAGLNFKDVLTALGRYPDASAALGHECAGEVVAVGAGTSSFAVGDAVVAFVAGSLATHVTADARLVAHLPATLSFEQGATVTGAFLTAQYALHDLAKLGAGDRVLIHAATGGVGLAAVQIAQRAGATIFATAGSESKRALLVSLGVTHVFNSRNAEFAPAIAALTQGRGVTVVLNSLTGEMLERSAELLVDGGRFVELGMATSQSAGAAEVLARRASYFNPNVAREAAADPPRFGGMLRDLLAAIERGELRPLPVQAFDADDAISAFRLMARAGHVGKLAIRENSPIGAAAAGARPPAQMAPDASYLIVGGLGGLGSVLIPWLVERGARHIAVMTRRDPSVEEARSLSELAERGVQLVVVRADVSSRDAVDAALARIAEAMPPLRGVIHAAGVLDDGALGRQTWERFARVMAPKVAGSWNLHEATSNVDLDFFILFSSVASVLGSKGQANHAAANAFLDALAHHRRAGGLPALSINWGAWSGVGAAAQRAIGDRIASRGWGEIRPDEGLAAFGRLLGWPRPQIAVAPIDWRVYAGEFAEEHAPPLLADLMREDGVAASPPAGRTARESVGPTVAADVRAVSPGERRAVIERFLRGQVGKVLGLAPNRHVDADTPLIDLGLDSLLAVELRNTLSRGLALPRRLPATLLFDYPTIATLSEHLLSMIVEQSPARAVPEPAAVVERSGTLPSFERAVDDRDIAELTDEEAEALLLRELE